MPRKLRGVAAAPLVLASATILIAINRRRGRTCAPRRRGRVYAREHGPAESRHRFSGNAVVAPAVPTVFLVSCVSQKRAARSRARDLYTSPLFTKARAYVESHQMPWFILSAEYGLLEPDAEVEPYERTLNDMAVADRREWARRVLEQLEPRLAGVQRIVILAGMRYREFLLPRLNALCPRVEVPLEGLPIGKQLQWLTLRERDQT